MKDDNPTNSNKKKSIIFLKHSQIKNVSHISMTEISI